MVKKVTFILIALLVVSLVACAKSTPTPAPSPTPTPTPTPTMTPVKWIFDASASTPLALSSKSFQWFVGELEKRTNGLIKTEIIFSFGLSKMGEELDANRRGLSQLVKLVPGFQPTRLYMQDFGMAVPFTINDLAKAVKIHETIYYDEKLLDPELTPLSLKYLWGLTLPYELMSMVPVTKLDDLKGMKIANTPTSYHKLLTAGGATSLPLALFDRVPGLQTGMINGSCLTLDITFGAGIPDVAKYFMPLEFGTIHAEVYVINLEVFNKLPKDIQNIIEKLARETNTWLLETTIKELTEMKNTLVKKGVTINPPLSFVDKVKWATQAATIPAEWVKGGEQMGKPTKKLIERYIALVKATGHNFPIEYKLD